MKFVNTGEAVRLGRMLLFGDIDDRSVISVYDAQGRFLCRGRWFEDRILAYCDETGTAHKPGTGHSILFRLTR